MKHIFYLFILCILPMSLWAKTIVVPMHFVSESGTGESVGEITISTTKCGLLFTPHLHGLSPQLHGFHIHQKPSCDNNGMAAGDHLDPSHTNKHEGPYTPGHLGDLPALYVAQDGTATLPVLAPRLKISDLKDHSLMIHSGGDNYSDVPEKNGGGAGRMICGVIK